MPGTVSDAAGAELVTVTLVVDLAEGTADTGVETAEAVTKELTAMLEAVAAGSTAGAANTAPERSSARVQEVMLIILLKTLERLLMSFVEDLGVGTGAGWLSLSNASSFYTLIESNEMRVLRYETNILTADLASCWGLSKDSENNDQHTASTLGTEGAPCAFWEISDPTTTTAWKSTCACPVDPRNDPKTFEL